MKRGVISANPCNGVDPPSAPRERDRTLTDSEVRAVWQAAEGIGYPFGPVVQLLIVLGQRRDEVAGLTWGELDLDAAEWTLPAARAKNDRPPSEWSALRYGFRARMRTDRMTRKRHKPEEIVAKLRQVDVLVSQGRSVADALRSIAVTEVTYDRWRQEFGGLKSDQVKRLKDLETENLRLCRAVADLTLDKLIPWEAASGNC